MNLKKSDFFLLIIVSIDILFILLSLLDGLPFLNLNNFNVSYENLFAEKFQYLKFIGIATMSFLLAIKSRSPKFLLFMIIPIYLYFDDSRGFHEKFGSKIASFLYEDISHGTLIINFRYQDIGEFLYMLLI